jgi:hypothetical protein
MSAPDIPTSFTFTLGGGIDAGLDDIRINNLPLIKLETAITSLPKIVTDSKIDAGLDNIRITELPKIEIEMGMKPTRVHLPSHYQMCFSILGMEMLKFGFCGESMVITEPYVPRLSEECA